MTDGQTNGRMTIVWIGKPIKSSSCLGMQISWSFRSQPSLKYSVQSDRQIQCFTRTFRQLDTFLSKADQCMHCLCAGHATSLRREEHYACEYARCIAHMSLMGFASLESLETWVDLMLQVIMNLFLGYAARCTTSAWHATHVGRSAWGEGEEKEMRRRGERSRRRGGGRIVLEPAGKPICAHRLSVAVAASIVDFKYIYHKI